MIVSLRERRMRWGKFRQSPNRNLQVIYVQSAFGQLAFANVGQMVLTADRSKVIVASADSDSTLGLYDPSTGNAISGRATGIVSEILPTPGRAQLFMTHTTGQFEVFDANTLAKLGGFQSPSMYGSSSAVLSLDGSTFYSVDSLGNVFAYDTTSFGLKGWVPNFDVFDSQQQIVLSMSDEAGLVVGPIGHGVEFLDSTQIESGSPMQTSFNLGFLSPGTGTPSGGTSFQAQVSEPNATQQEHINSGTVYVGNAAALNVTVSNTSATGLTPPAAAGGAADVVLVLPDGSIQLNPENFSYGPVIVELSTNAASAEGGSQGVIFGYGLGQKPSDVTIGVGGQSAQVTQVIPSVAPILPYPFPMEAVLFTIPPGNAGTQAVTTATTAAGSTSSSTPLTYVPAVRNFASPSGALMQGIYDSTRSLMYFTDQTQIDVFSPASNDWLAPISIPQANGTSRLMGIALSPNGNVLVISDAGQGNVYLLNPSSPSNVEAFNVTNGHSQPYAAAVTNSGIVYYSSYEAGIDPPGHLLKLDSRTGKITDFGGWGDSSFDRLLISPDGSTVYGSFATALHTATDTITGNIYFGNSGDGNIDLALSGDGSTLLTEDMLTDPSLNIEGGITYVDRDVWLPLAVYGQKLNSDGSLVFQPTTEGIDVLDATTGLLMYRVALPIQYGNAYDALAIDDQDGLLFAITTTGIAEVNLSGLPASALRQKHAFRTVTMPLGAGKARPGTGKAENRKLAFQSNHLHYAARVP